MSPRNGTTSPRDLSPRRSETSSPRDGSPRLDDDSPRDSTFNPYTEFPEFSRKQLKKYAEMFKKYDLDSSGKIDFEELKKMMEKLGNAQTHLTLKGMITEVDEDLDGQISYREFLLIFRKAAEGTLQNLAGFDTLLTEAKEVDVSVVGVSGAKNFFEAKAAKLSAMSASEAEIKAEQAERRQANEAKAARKADFKEKLAAFNK